MRLAARTRRIDDGLGPMQTSRRSRTGHVCWIAWSRM